MKKMDFTCKKVSLSDLVQCNYNLNGSEYAIFSEVIKSKRGLSVKEIVEKVNKDRTTVQKILTRILKRGLVMKKQLNMERGFMYVYFSKNRDEIIKEIEVNVDTYFKSIKDNLNKWRVKI